MDRERASRRPAHPPGIRPVRYLLRAISHGVRRLSASPWLKFLTGVVLLTSGLDEAIETLYADLSSLELGAHHGVMVLGFMNIFTSLPDMFDGLFATFLVEEPAETADEEVAGDDDSHSPSEAAAPSPHPLRRAA